MDLFDAAATTASGTPTDATAPLAVRMRPRTVDEVVGQQHLLAPGQPLRRLIEPGRGSTSSIFLWGPPGIGKTTLAYLVATQGGRRFVEISAVSAGVRELRAVIKQAKDHLVTSGQETVLFIDEVHRFSKTQQDALLPAVENGWVILIAATTENPSFSVISPLLSRSLLLTLHPLSDDDVRTLLNRALEDERGYGGSVQANPEALQTIVRLAAGDGRRALTILEAAVGGAQEKAAKAGADAAEAADSEGESAVVVPKTKLGLEEVEAAVDFAVRYDRDGDQHYDVISAFIKSIRGSDVDAAMHYLARMLEAGEDPRFVARRLMISAAEDIGMADPSALQTATAAAQSVALVGMPEARIILAEAVVHLATAPKSNRAYLAINKAIADVRAGKVGQVPVHLRDKSVKASKIAAEQTGKNREYVYPHDEPTGVARQQYLPDELVGTVYYEPLNRGFEANITQRMAKINELLHGS